MKFKCEVREQEAQPALAMRVRTPVDKLPQIMGESYASIAHYLGELGKEPAGPPFVVYYNMDMQDLDIEMGIPVGSDIPGRGEIHMTELPAGKMGTCLYTGPYNEIEQGYNVLSDWVVEHHYESSGVAYEVYLNDPSVTPPQELQTLIVFPLKSV